MKKIALLALGALFVALALVGCGSSTKVEYVYVQQAQAVVAEGDFFMDVAGKVQKISLNLDEAGIIHGLQGAGTKKYNPRNVVAVKYISERQHLETSPLVSAETGKELLLVFNDVINNDHPRIIVLMDDGEQYDVETRALTFHATEEISFFAREYGFEYGHQENSVIDVVRNLDNTIKFKVFFGCNKLVGLLNDVDPASVGGVAWELEDGTLYSAVLSQNSYGSYFASIENVPLIQASPAVYGQGPSTTGRLVVFSKNGLRIPLVDSRDGFEWMFNYAYPNL